MERTVELDVLAAGEVPREARAELQQRDHPTADVDPARVGRHDARQHPQGGGLPGAVAPNQPDRLPGLNVQ